jgi:hypothetical protein
MRYIETLKCSCGHIFTTSKFKLATNSQNIGEREAQCPKCNLWLICWAYRAPSNHRRNISKRI